ALVSGQAVVATALGIFGAEGAADLNERDKTQFAALVSYRLRSTSESGRVSSFDVDVQYRSRDFSPMAEARAEPNRYRYDIAARYQTELLEDTYGTFSASYGKARRGFRDQKSASAGLSRSFGRFNVGLNYSYIDNAPRAD